jgi:internalin A
MPQPSPPMKIFFSYAHEDEKPRARLQKHLALMERSGAITIWFDRKLLPGQKWANVIDTHLEQADIVLLLVSADFVASDYCWDKEMARALERHNAGDGVVIPILVRPVDYAGAPFAQLQMLPSNGRPVSLWGSRDAAWADAVKGIKQVVLMLAAKTPFERATSGSLVVPTHAALPLGATAP